MSSPEPGFFDLPRPKIRHFIAQYSGQCVHECSGIRPGDVVSYTKEGHLQHEVCPEDVLELVGESCQNCFLTLPLSGVCDCAD